jgi:gamma-glutamyltranspeptidase/glutathione hydrolase
MKGAVSAGSPYTTEAGLHALRSGGNAIDAAIASTLMAGVAEPLLSGIGGAGMATVRFDGQIDCVDFFSNMPGIGASGPPSASMEDISIDYGPTTQSFLVGNAAAAVPGVPCGISAMHERYGSLPMSTLALPAIRAAQEGVPVTAGFERVCELLWPILNRTDAVRALFSRNGRPLKQGDQFVCPDLADTIHSFAEQGPDYFTNGAGAQAILNHLGTENQMTSADLQAQQAVIRKALPVRYRDATLWIPSAPSAAGISLAHSLSVLESQGPLLNPTGVETISRIAEALNSTFAMRGKPFLSDLFTDGFAASFLARVQASRMGTKGATPGYTTHISTVDEQGNAVSITHSLGETAGEVAGNTGVLINNFLGEADVNPPFFQRPAGGRLITMCCPSILELSDGRFIALGSGGSSRIPTAVLHGTIYLTDACWPVEKAVTGPRTHIEGDALHVETWNRGPLTMEAVAERWPNHIRFDGPNMFFGGLHMAGVGPNGFCGSGDSRRSGSYGTT